MSRDLRMLTGYPEWFLFMALYGKDGENRKWPPPQDWLRAGGWLALHAGANIGGSTSKKGQAEAFDQALYTAWRTGGIGDQIATEAQLLATPPLTPADIPHRRVVAVQRVDRVWLPAWGIPAEDGGVRVSSEGRAAGCPGSPWWMCSEDESGRRTPQYFWHAGAITVLPGLPRLEKGALGLQQPEPDLCREIWAQYDLVQKLGLEGAAREMGVSLDWRAGRWREITATLTGYQPVLPSLTEEAPEQVPVRPTVRETFLSALPQRVAEPVIGPCACCGKQAHERCRRCAVQVASATCRCSCKDGPEVHMANNAAPRRGAAKAGMQQVGLALPGFTKR